MREMSGARPNPREAGRRLAERLIQTRQATRIEEANTNMPMKVFRDW